MPDTCPPPPPPPRVPEPPAAWPATPSHPTAPAAGDAREGQWLASLTDAQRCWVARYGTGDEAMQLIPHAGRSFLLYATLVHRAERSLSASVAGHHLPYPGDPPDPEGAARLAGLRYFVAHAALAGALPTFLHMLQHARLDRPLVLAIWHRVATDLPGCAAPLCDASGRLTTDGAYAQRVLGALARHPLCPPALLPALAALALDPCFGGEGEYEPGGALVLDCLLRAAAAHTPGLVTLDPAAFAPVLHRCSAPWRTRLLTEVLPVLDGRAARAGGAEPAALGAASPPPAPPAPHATRRIR